MKNYIIICALFLFTTSCSDSFFDLEPSDKITNGKYYQTAEDFNLAVMSCYAKLQGQVAFYTECSEYRSDNIYISAPTAGTYDRYELDRFQDTPANGILSDYWANFNNAVYRANAVLDRIDNAKFSENLKKQYKGEALFMRAYAYFNMYRMWGGVPVTLKVVSVEESYKIGRCSDEQMYQYLVNDLKAIIDGNLLPESYSGVNLGRVTMGAAKALLGKVHLTAHKWAEARDVLADIITQYKLMDTPSEVFDVKNKMNKEIIFAVRFNKAIDGEGHGFWYSTSNPSSTDLNYPVLKNSCYTEGDKRFDLLSYTPSGTVYAINKFYDTEDPTFKTVGNDQILLRYADVLLMYAEALNEIAYDNSSDSPALKYLNQVHTRAGLTAINIIELPDKESVRKAILDERQKEFPFEGHRWFDLVRMGYAQKVMSDQGYNVPEYRLKYPIPSSEIERVNNLSLLWQNPGY